jgi:hypothetical protein
MVHKLGICIPYRDRETHLKTLIPHLTKFLNKKDIKHSFYIAHQIDDKLFNRGAMKNIAAKHAFEDGCDYVAFHDVDMLPENENCDYSYPIDYPTHIATKLSKYKYKLNYEQYFGGVVLFTKEQVEKTNGYSNDYWDWGMEDDDLFWRCVYEDMTNCVIFSKYTNKKYFAFNGDGSYIHIRKELGLHSILSNSHTISILCSIDNQPDKYNHWLVGDEAKSFIEYPIFRSNNKNGYGIGFNNSRAICSSIRNSNNNFNYGWIKRNFNEWTWVTISVDTNSNNIYFYCNNKLIKNTTNGTLEESYSNYEGTLQKIDSDFYIGKNSDNITDMIAPFLKGKVAEIKVWNKFFKKEEIEDIILKNKETPYFELTNDNKKLHYNNIVEESATFDVINNIIPHRREGRFLSLPHTDEGFVGGKWAKGETTARNEKRFFLEMKAKKLNYKDDGIAQIKYDLVSKEQIADNAWMINIKL